MGEFKFVCIVFLVLPVFIAYGNYALPEVTIEALPTGEFRAYIPDSPGMREFTPHVRINEKIEFPEIGDYSVEVTEKTGDFWIARFPNSNIKIGDTIYLWVYVNVNGFGYLRTNINTTITSAVNSYPKLNNKCVVATTVFDGGKQACVGNQIIFDDFDGSDILGSKWTVEHWIPSYTAPHYLFNSYQNIAETRYINDGRLYIKPIALKTEEDVRGNLDLRNGCTSKVTGECHTSSKSWKILSPVKSAKLTSKIAFKYGRVDIRAKLPKGDWIFPIIQLEQKIKENAESSPKVWIAYSRGNDVLRGRDQSDIGSRILFGGPVLFPIEPTRSQHLVSRRSSTPFYNSFHVYTIEWLPGNMTFKIDDAEYGSIDLSRGLVDDIDMRGGNSAPFQSEFLLTLGVGVGGILDFPDNFMSGNRRKPWSNDEPKFIKAFFDKRSEWSTTWNGDNAALQVDYVKVTAL